MAAPPRTPGQKVKQNPEQMALQVKAYHDKSRAFKKPKPKEIMKVANEEFVRMFVDRSGNIRRDFLKMYGQAGYKVVQGLVLQAGAPAAARAFLDQMYKEVYSGLPRKLKHPLDDHIFNQRMKAIGRYKHIGTEFVAPEGMTLDHFIYSDASLQRRYGLSNAEWEMVQNRAKAYDAWMKKLLE